MWEVEVGCVQAQHDRELSPQTQHEADVAKIADPRLPNGVLRDAHIIPIKTQLYLIRNNSSPLACVGYGCTVHML